jgi:filamentous hemagglutinin family protein
MNRISPSIGNDSARFALKAIAASLTLAFGANVYALPTGGTTAAGGATIAGAGAGKLTVTQSTQNAVINWQSFSIGQGEAVRFVQPNSTSVALNRVLGADPSSIFGSLSANGKVFLVNPNGILFGQGAQVNVGGLVASTLRISDADFMAGAYRFSGAGNGSIVNRGSINADGGYVALLGANVSNEGVITANMGTVALAAGNAMTLDVAGDGLLNVAVNQGAVNALVQNGGLIRANGGQVMMTAQAAGNLLNTVVNNTGIIEAQTLENSNGTIRLLGDMQSGTVNVGGTLDASGTGAGQTGGSVRVLGHTVNLANAVINASGDAGGGLVLVGGNFNGAGPEQNSQTTSMNAASLVNADAIRTGNGGRIAVWSDGNTSVAGTLSARGGANAGNGGFIETSGKHVFLAETLRVNTLAANGKTGMWLLDPFPDHIIATVGGDETPAQVELSLATTNRVIAVPRDIIVSDAVTWSTARTLELRAGNDVRVNAAMTASTAGSGILFAAVNNVVVTGAVTASGAGSTVNMTGRNVTTTGAITASANGATISMSASENASVGVVTANGGGSVTLRGGNNVVVNGTISADGGPVTLIADNDGTGPGVAGGTVSFVAVGQVVSPNTTIRFNPATYAATTAEIANYVTRVSAASDIRAWVFAQGVNKTYDGTTAATLAFRGDPTSGGDVTLIPGTATFDTPNVGTTKTVTYNGFTTGGVNVARFSLFSAAVPGAGTTTANITQAPLTITANNATKVYGETAVLATTAFTSVGLVNAETVGSVTETSPGTVATATVAGSTYAITPSNATGGTFTPSNYAINFINGTLTVTPAPLIVTASNVSKVYGESPTLSAFTQTGLVNGETIGSVTETSPGTAPTASVAAGPYVITASNAAGGTFTPSNYTTTFLPGVLTVSGAPLLVTASNVTKSFGQTAVLTAFTTTGLVNSETVGRVTLASPGAVSSATVAGSPYAITASDPTGGTFTPSNYTIAFRPGTLAVTPVVVVPPGSTRPGSTPPGATPPDQPTGTIPTPTDPSTTDPSTTSPGVTSLDSTTSSPDTTTSSPDTTTTSPGTTGVGATSAVAGLNLTVVGGGVNVPPVQLVQMTPAVRAAPVALAPATGPGVTPPAEVAPVSSTEQAQRVVRAARPAAAPAPSVPVRRIPKNDRN